MRRAELEQIKTYETQLRILSILCSSMLCAALQLYLYAQEKDKHGTMAQHGISISVSSLMALFFGYQLHRIPRPDNLSAASASVSATETASACLFFINAYNASISAGNLEFHHAIIEATASGLGLLLYGAAKIIKKAYPDIQSFAPLSEMFLNKISDEQLPRIVGINVGLSGCTIGFSARNMMEKKYGSAGSEMFSAFFFMLATLGTLFRMMKIGPKDNETRIGQIYKIVQGALFSAAATLLINAMYGHLNNKSVKEMEIEGAIAGGCAGLGMFLFAGKKCVERYFRSGETLTDAPSPPNEVTYFMVQA